MLRCQLVETLRREIDQCLLQRNALTFDHLIIRFFFVNAKFCKRHVKMNKKIIGNVPKCPLFDSIPQYQHYLTLKNVFVLYAKLISWPV